MYAHVIWSFTETIASTTSLSCNQGLQILQSFVYPDSRVQFLGILSRAGLSKELEAGLKSSGCPQILDFWSDNGRIDIRKDEAALSQEE